MRPTVNGHDPAINERIRDRAHEVLDELFNQVDGKEGAFGVVGIEVSVQNGYLLNIEERFSRRHK